ncbi:hypothetical protein EAE90_04635 [Photorhabdus caribbeanensis]|nr:hypothetical protein [Photorhabdus caribbeanensis]
MPTLIGTELFLCLLTDFLAIIFYVVDIPFKIFISVRCLTTNTIVRLHPPTNKIVGSVKVFAILLSLSLHPVPTKKEN